MAVHDIHLKCPSIIRHLLIKCETVLPFLISFILTIVSSLSSGWTNPIKGLETISSSEKPSRFVKEGLIWLKKSSFPTMQKRLSDKLKNRHNSSIDTTLLYFMRGLLG